MTTYLFNDDGKALQALDGRRFAINRSGMITPLSKAIVETPEETAAINFLCAEWDYGYEEI